MSLYCMNCKKFIKVTNKRCKCATSDLISVTENMLPVVHIIANDLWLEVSSAFCLTDTHNRHHTLVEAGVYFKSIYPEILLQDLPSGWYLSDYLTLDNKSLCSCLAYEAEIDTGAVSLEEFVDGVINDLIGYLATLDKDGLMSVLTLLES